MMMMIQNLLVAVLVLLLHPASSTGDRVAKFFPFAFV
jgi:hypothetical protein